MNHNLILLSGNLLRSRRAGVAIFLVMALAGWMSYGNAQSIGGMTSGSSGSAAAGGSPVGFTLPTSVQAGSTAPTQPGHTITGDRGYGRPAIGVADSSASGDSANTATADATFRRLDRANAGYLTADDVKMVTWLAFAQADSNQDGRLSKEEFTTAWNARLAR